MKKTNLLLIPTLVLAMGILILSARPVMARLLQQNTKAKPTPAVTPTPTPTPDSLALTAEEVQTGSVILADLQEQQRQYSVAIVALLDSAKRPNDKEGHHGATMTLAAQHAFASEASTKWETWLQTAQTKHNCTGCGVNLNTRRMVPQPSITPPPP